MTVYWLVWDAAAAWIVDRLDAEGALPAVRQIRASGVRARARPPRPNCQTPAALASLFTGADPAQHGVTGFRVPGGPRDPVERHRAGFGSAALARPPLWREPGAERLRTAFVHVPWVLSPDGVPGPGVVAAVEAYSQRLASADRLVLPEPGQARGWWVGPYPLRVHARTGGARLTALDRPAPAVDLFTGREWVPVRRGPASGFWVRYLSGTGEPMLVHTGAWSRRAAGSDRQIVEQLASGPVFAGEGLTTLYRSGELGARLVDGGDGRAEEVFVSSLGCVVRSVAAAADALLATSGIDLVVIYLSITDDAGHELVGWCDERSAAYRPDLAAAIWPQVRRCYGWADAILGRLLDHAEPVDTVVLSADHGIVGSSRLVAVNECLIASGLATVAPGGGLDPRSSRVIYHPANNGALRVNHTGLPGGLVPRPDSGAMLRAAAEALVAIPAAPGDGPVVRGFLDARGRPVDPATLDAYQDTLFVVMADDYQPTAAVDGGRVLRPMHKSAAHVVNTGSDRLHGTFAAAGPGVPAGGDLGVVESTISAALVRRQLGRSGSWPTAAAPGPASGAGRERTARPMAVS